MRHNPIMGPAEITASLAIPCEANPTTNPHISFFEGYAVRIDGQLFTVHQGSADESW